MRIEDVASLPELVLLHKATSSVFTETADFDFAVVVPAMTTSSRLWLLESLSRVDPRHHWIDKLRVSLTNPLSIEF